MLGGGPTTVPVPPNPADRTPDVAPEGKPGAGPTMASPPPRPTPEPPEPRRNPPPSRFGAGPATATEPPNPTPEPVLASRPGIATGGPMTVPAPPNCNPEPPAPSCKGNAGAGPTTARTPPMPTPEALELSARSCDGSPGAGATTAEWPRLTPAMARTGPSTVGDGPTANETGAATPCCRSAAPICGGGATTACVASGLPEDARLVRCGEATDPNAGADRIAGKGRASRNPAMLTPPAAGISAIDGAFGACPPLLTSPRLTIIGAGIGAGRVASLPPCDDATCGR